MSLFSASTAGTANPQAAAPSNDVSFSGVPQLPPELQKTMAKVTEIGSLPEITTRIVQIVEDPKSTAHDMHEIVRSDPALAAKVLKVVNSAFYGLPSQISSLDRAIVMLGLSAVKNIALAASLSRLFRPGALSERFAVRDLWTHCISVGVCTRMIAEASFGQAEEAFVGGLVHDVGLLVEYQLFPDKLREVSNRCEASTQNFLIAEREIIGADHTVFGATIAARWKFPLSLRNAITFHHDPSTLRPEYKRVLTAIQVADTICCQNQVGFFLTAATQEVNEEQLAAIGISSEKLGSILEVLPEKVSESERIFGD
jgi:putative nucleotidyltransferase with HDIG domain